MGKVTHPLDCYMYNRLLKCIIIVLHLSTASD
jgi:hypothetical protein